MEIPKDIDIERAVIGLCLESVDNYERVTRLLTGDPSIVFSATTNADWMQAISAIANRREAIDTATVRIEMQRRGKWSDARQQEIATLLNASVQHRGSAIDSMVMHLFSLHVKRRTIEQCTETLQQCYDPTVDAFECLNLHHAGLAKIDQPIAKHSFTTPADLFDPFVEKLRQAQHKVQSGERLVAGQTTGLTLVDYHTGGNKPGQLIVIAARPKEGKSTYAINSAKAGALEGDPQAILSLEMDDEMQLARMMADLASVPNNRIQQAKLTVKDWESIGEVRERVISLPIYFGFYPKLHILQLIPKIRWLVRENSVKRVFIDYLQLMGEPPVIGKQSNYDNENAKIAKITGALKELAGELGITIVLLSQMSRDIEKRAGEKRPMLSDLRSSGSIEQDADMVIFLYSPRAYLQAIPQYCAQYYPSVPMEIMERLTFLIIVQRNAKSGLAIPIWSDLKYMRMHDIREAGVYKTLGAWGLLDETEENNPMQALGILSATTLQQQQQQELFESDDFPF